MRARAPVIPFHAPPEPRKVPTPESADAPAPEKTRQRLADRMESTALSIGEGVGWRFELQTRGLIGVLRDKEDGFE